MPKTILLSGLICLLTSTCCFAQLPTASEAHAVLKMEVGTWDAVVKVWPDGQDEKPIISKASETNRMMGELWLLTDYKGEFDGKAFSGHGVFGYDPEKKKYVGTWVDSIAPEMSRMEGEYDKEKKTMTYLMVGKGPDGKPQKTKLVTVISAEKRVMTMLLETEGESVKMMEIVYTRSKK